VPRADRTCRAGDANNGYIDPLSLAQCVQQAKAQGWAAGVSAWQFPHADTAWITTVRSLAWPVSGASPPPTTTPPPGAGCGGAPAWSASATYTANARVSFGGHLWTAQWWTQGDAPGTTNSGAAVWKDNGAC
jgi:chitinase